MSAELLPCFEHDFVYLRQEKTNIGYERNPRYRYEDVFFCRKCLTHKRLVVRETVPSRDRFGEEVVA